MNIQEIKGLLDQFDQSSLTEFDLKEGNFELYFNKNTSSGKERLYATPAAETPAIGGTQLQTTSTHEETTETIVTEEAKAEGTSIVSPLVGVVYLQPTPEKPAFKKLGDQVKKGEVLCIIEAMKVMNEITSEVSGEITAILVENEQTVEYNQPLFVVKEG